MQQYIADVPNSRTLLLSAPAMFSAPPAGPAS
jgi:hypothetical protein